MCEIRAANSIFNEFRHFTIFKMIKTNFKWDQLCGEKKSMLWRKIQYCGVKVNFSVKKQWETFLFKIISESSWIKQIFSLNKLLNHCFGFKQFCSNYRLFFSSFHCYYDDEASIKKSSTIQTTNDICFWIYSLTSDNLGFMFKLNLHWMLY